MHKLILLGLLPSVALAGRASSPFLLRRTDSSEAQTCEELGMQDCGGCIPLDYSCCPSKQGGCAAGMVCVLGDDLQDGCCPDGYTCTGNGGIVSTTFSQTPSSSAAVEVPEPTATSTGNGDIPVYSEVPAPTLEPPPGPTEEPPSSASTAKLPSSIPDQDAAQPHSTTGSASSSETASPEEPTSPTTISNSTSASTSQTATPDATSSTGSSSSVSGTATATATGAPSPSASDSDSIILITKTIAVSTTICPPAVDTTSPVKPQDVVPTTTVIAPVIKPSVVCPGQGKACHPVVVGDDNDTGSGTGSATPIPAPSPTGLHHIPSGTGTGAVVKPSKTGQAVVTAGAARISGGMGGMGGVGAAVVVGVVVAGYL